MQVLLIDDSPTSRLHTKHALDQALPGMVIDEVGSGLEAQAWLGLNNADLLICDLEMEDGDGIELIQWLRSQAAFKGTRVLVHSSYVDVLVKAVMNRYQPLGFLSKPATASEIHAAVLALWQPDRDLARI
jgi:DNA-binding NarL/FixJ family response regulator